MSLENRLLYKLSDRQQNGNLRTLKPETGQVDFCSNDYLGLAQNASLTALIEENYHRTNRRNGSGGSRLLAGNTQYATDLEEFLAGIFQCESTLVFQSGYAANAAVLSCVPEPGDTILCDALIHASLREGAKLSAARRVIFRHNDLPDLEDKLKQATGSIFVVSEAVFSMDGDFGDLAGLLHLCQKYDAYLIWDEAHSTGTYGTAGSGLAYQLGLHPLIFARIHTFGKAPGVHGACVAGSRTLCDYLINFARPFVFSTAPPLHSLVSIRSSFEFLQQHPQLQPLLQEKIAFFRKEIERYPTLAQRLLPSESPIQILQISGNEATRNLAGLLQAQDFDVRPILSPTVAAGTERLRLCLHTFNTEADIQKMLHTAASGL